MCLFPSAFPLCSSRRSLLRKSLFRSLLEEEQGEKEDEEEAAEKRKRRGRSLPSRGDRWSCTDSLHERLVDCGQSCTSLASAESHPKPTVTRLSSGPRRGSLDPS